MGFIKVDCRWIHKGKESNEEARRDEAGPSEPAIPTKEGIEEEAHTEMPSQEPNWMGGEDFMDSFDFQPPHGEGSSSQTVRLDEEQLKLIVEQVMAGILSSRFSGFNRQEPPSTQAELSTDRSLEPHFSTLNQMMIDLRHEISNIRFLVTS